ncbi:MAG TPA: response regulator transcription factor [Chthonomonadaceae bacterium]|nr:response regulator transcription factor [Chthonomonadaceae bacterium]
MRVLLLEDDEAIAEVVRQGLEEARYSVEVAENGEKGLEMAAQQEYELIILDIMLPEMSGWEVCQQLRARRDLTPILMLTARDATQDRVRGLDLGADDYLTKPFDFAELLARLRALQRRDKMHRTRLIQIADLEMDTGSRRVFRAGREVNLTEREYSLLEALAAYEGRTLTREFIQERVWHDDASYSNTVDAYIRLLRKKIDANHDLKLIQTIHGVGYALRTTPDEDDP